MAGTIVGSTLQINNLSDTANTLVTFDGSQVTADKPFFNGAKAWVNFGWNGSAIVIRASYNVSSVVRVSTGIYTINFATAMPDVNYIYSLSIDNDSGDFNHAVYSVIANKTIGSMRIKSGYPATLNYVDKNEYSVAVFR